MDTDPLNLSKSERAYFNSAKSVSELSDHRCKIGCVVVDGHRIISSGHNSKTKFHRIQSELDNKYFPGYENKGPVHAEISALIPLIKISVEIKVNVITGKLIAKGILSNKNGILS